jgi:hypothetical protein
VVGELATSGCLAFSAVFGPAGREVAWRVGKVERVELVSAGCGAPQRLSRFMVRFERMPGSQVVLATGGPAAVESMAPDGKPRRASSTVFRPRNPGATSSPTDQGLEVEPPLGVVNGRGARRCGNAGSAVAGGHALEGPASVGKVGSCAGMRSPRTRNPVNPRVGSGMQQARNPLGGASRQGGEKPRSRNMLGRWHDSAEAGATLWERVQWLYDGGAIFEEP